MRYFSDVISLYPFVATFSTLFQEIISYTLAGLIVLCFASVVIGILRSRVQGAFRGVSFFLCDYSSRALFIPISGIFLKLHFLS